MTINWYPGHMVKAKKEIQENIKLVDIVIILLDARAPFSCRNIELEKIARKRKVILVLNKMDLTPPSVIKGYMAKLRDEGDPVVCIDSVQGKGTKEVLQVIRNVYKSKAKEMLDKGRRVRPARIMVVGIPNVGKSTFLNCLVGKKIAKTGDKPGVTRGKQWVRVREDIEFMDTPGLMWPKIEEEEQGLKLALLNIVGENAYNEYDIALYLIKVLKEKAPQGLLDKYKLQNLDKPEIEIMEDIAKKRGYILKEGELDLEKTYRLLLQDFRKGKLGNIGLD